MKITGVVFLSLCLAFLGSACASTAKLLAQNDPIALVSLVSNSDINWKGEDSLNPKQVGLFAARAMRSEPGLVLVSGADELINRAETLVRDVLKEGGILRLTEREKMLASQAYREARISKVYVNQEFVKPKDLRFVDYRDKNFAAAFALETGIQRTMYVEFKFVKNMANAIGKNGSCRAEVDMTVYVYNALGKLLYRKTVSMWSMNTIKVSMGVYPHSDLIALFESAIAEACYELNESLKD